MTKSSLSRVLPHTARTRGSAASTSAGLLGQLNNNTHQTRHL
jgi:hypothetical protein